jgi:hypothetical protein
MFADYATVESLINAPTYDNGVDGVGAMLTGSLNGALIVDGVSLVNGDTVLVKDQFSFDTGEDFQNGVYIVTQQGSPTTPYILTRVDYADESAELFPSQVNVLKGVTNKDRFFLQKTESPSIGLDPVVYEINYVPPTQSVILPVIHVDTVTTEPLPDCTYEEIFDTLPGGYYNSNPTTAYLTATVNGPLGVINNVFMSTGGFIAGGKKILVRNQVNPALNGDYEIVAKGMVDGSPTAHPWKLKRITTSYYNFNKGIREWKVNNENCTYYGNRYYMNNHSTYGIMGSTPITFSELDYLEPAPVDGSQYVRKDNTWDKLTTYSAVDPAATNTIVTGFPLGSDWFNTITGEKFYHKADGVWISYTSSVTPPTPGGDSPVMFADYATSNELPSSTYYNGPLDDGIGATITAATNSKLKGIVGGAQAPMLVGMTLLVKDEMPGDIDSGMPSNRPHNGLYIVTQEGCSLADYLSGCTPAPWVLTRVEYANEPGELYPSQVNILSGVNQNRFFLQQNVIDNIGVEEVVYEINYVPPTQVITLPVVHMDTATTAPLPSCTYMDEFPPPTPGGIFTLNPTTSYLTATVNGPLGVINGVNVSNSFTDPNRKILVKDQADNKQNGDYEIVQNGSATQPWKLRRITTTYSSLNKNTREWKINNEACTLYGNRYYMNYYTPSISIIGTTPITFSELAAGGIQNLQDVTDIGNTTTNNIQFGTGAGVFMDNGSRLKEGTIDAGYGGSKGIAQICAVGYELKWEAGRLYVMGDGGTTIREVSHNFATTPTVWDDETRGFVFKSRWILDNGTLYVCYDATAGAAVWVLQTVGNQDLQSVTTRGNVTTTEIISESGLIVNSADIPDSAAYLAKLGIFSILQSGTLRYGGSFELRETSADGSGNVALVLPSVLTADRVLYLPNKNGTLAVTTDIPSVDSTPTNGSTNPVSSDGVFDALALKADLVAGKVPASQLPSYVDDVIEGYYSAPTFYSNAGLTIPIVPETGKIYVDLLANKSYRWSGSVYIQISNAISSIDELTDVTVTSPLNGQLLQYNLTTNQWENQSITIGTGDMQKSTYDADNDGIVDFAETVPVVVRNTSVSDILRKGTIVYLNGSTGYRPNAFKAQANAEATSSGTFGVVLADIATNSDGTVAMLGTVHTLDTRNAANGNPYPFTDDVLADGDVLWLDPNNAGYVTKTKPQAPNHIVFIGVVARTHPSLGRIVYRITNGYELDELHNVFINGTLADNHILYYDLATLLWKTKTIAQVLGFTPQQAITVTTTGTSGPATLSGGILNIPQYSGGGGTTDINIINATKLTLMYNT